MPVTAQFADKSSNNPFFFKNLGSARQTHVASVGRRSPQAPRRNVWEHTSVLESRNRSWELIYTFLFWGIQISVPVFSFLHNAAKCQTPTPPAALISKTLLCNLRFLIDVLRRENRDDIISVVYGTLPQKPRDGFIYKRHKSFCLNCRRVKLFW